MNAMLLTINKNHLFLDGMQLKWVEKYELKKGSGFPLGGGELTLTMLVNTPDSVQGQGPSQAEVEDRLCDVKMPTKDAMQKRGIEGYFAVMEERMMAEYLQIREECHNYGELSERIRKLNKEERFHHPKEAENRRMCLEKFLKEELDALPIRQSVQ